MFPTSFERASLSANKLFSGISEPVVAQCAGQFTLIRTGKRRELYVQGDECTELYCLVDGLVRVGRLTADGLDVTFCLLSSGDVFGLEALFRAPQHSMSAVTLEDSLLAVCRADCVRALTMRYPILALNIARYLREYHNRTFGQFQRMTLRRVRHRLIMLLRDLAADFGVADPHGTRIEAVLTHAELASLIATTRESVTFELSELARSGHILRRGRKIVICSRAEAA